MEDEMEQLAADNKFEEAASLANQLMLLRNLYPDNMILLNMSK